MQRKRLAINVIIEIMQEKSNNIIDKVYNKVMPHVNESGTDYSRFTNENAVIDFHGTFLSNFYIAPVTLNSNAYPSVEHAYQGAKFINFNWATMQQKVKDEISEALKVRGYAAPITYNQNLFTDEKMTAGNIKVVADILRKNHFVDKNWEDKRVKIMIELLLQKFERPELLLRLQGTDDKQLIENNDWGDTLWGVCGGKGRNILGAILMEIRKLQKKV